MHQTLFYDIQRNVRKFSENDKLRLYNQPLAGMISDIFLAMETDEIPVEDVVQELTKFWHSYSRD